MESGVAGRLIILLILLILSTFFSSAETAFTCVNKLRIRSQADEGSKRAALIYRLIDDPTKLLSMILIGNNLVNIAASSITTALMIKLFGNNAIGITTGILTLIILIFCEITPKTLATRNAEKLTYAFAPLINMLMIIFTPVVFIINKLSGAVLFLFGANKTKNDTQITENELLTIVDVSHEEGIIEKDEREMINNVVDFGDTIAKDVMVPAINMKCVPDDVTYSDLIKAFREDEYSRMPVYSESRDNIIGIIWAKDLLLNYKPNIPFKVKDYMREVYFTYEHKKIRELMADLRDECKSLAIVLDEYGATAGLISIEDLLEEIVGEIRDEYDLDEVDLIKKIDDNTYDVAGHTNLYDIDDTLGIKIESDDYDSIAGHVIHLLGHIPEVNEQITENNISYRILSLNKNRIEKIRIVISDKAIEEA